MGYKWQHFNTRTHKDWKNRNTHLRLKKIKVRRRTTCVSVQVRRLWSGSVANSWLQFARPPKRIGSKTVKLGGV